MKALILVDLDNVIGDGLLELVEDARPCLEKHGDRFDECVTAFAFNTVTAYNHGLTWQSLEDTARAFSTGLGAARSRVEIALALPMPQTADVLLARLAREAPSETNHGHYRLAVLLSADRELARDLGAEVFAREKSRWVQVERESWLSAWAPTPGAGPFVRKPPSTPRASGSEALPLSGAYTEVVSQTGQAGWAATHPLAPEARLELNALSLRVEEEPWLLSQVGATRSSLRGISRLPASAEVLGPVCTKDGLELRGDAPRPGELRDCAPASVGIGAVRSPVERATVASRLPVSVLKAALSTGIRCDRRGVAVRRVLQGASVGDALTEDSVEVRLRTAGRWLVAKVKHGSTNQPRAWWLVSETRVTSEQRIDRAGGFLPRSVQTTGVPFRAGRTSVLLGLRCPLEPGAQVRCDGAIAEGTIGQAWWDSPLGKSRPIAVYAPRHLAATDTLRVEPVHAAHRAPSELRDLPVVVAQ